MWDLFLCHALYEGTRSQKSVFFHDLHFRVCCTHCLFSNTVKLAHDKTTQTSNSDHKWQKKWNELLICSVMPQGVWTWSTQPCPYTVWLIWGMDLFSVHSKTLHMVIIMANGYHYSHHATWRRKPMFGTNLRWPKWEWQVWINYKFCYRPKMLSSQLNLHLKCYAFNWLSIHLF